MVNMAFTRACCLDTTVIQNGNKGSYFFIHSMNEALKDEGFPRGAYMFIKHRPCVFLKKAGVPYKCPLHLCRGYTQSEGRNYGHSEPNPKPDFYIYLCVRKTVDH